MSAGGLPSELVSDESGKRRRDGLDSAPAVSGGHDAGTWSCGGPPEIRIGIRCSEGCMRTFSVVLTCLFLITPGPHEQNRDIDSLDI